MLAQVDLSTVIGHGTLGKFYLVTNIVNFAKNVDVGMAVSKPQQLDNYSKKGY